METYRWDNELLSIDELQAELKLAEQGGDHAKIGSLLAAIDEALAEE